MIRFIVLSNDQLRVIIPKHMNPQAAKDILGPIWPDEFANNLDFVLESTETTENFVEKAKLDRNILVSH